MLKSNLVLKLGFMLKFAYIQNFELILDILDHPKPSISSLKQPACYLEITPIIFNMATHQSLSRSQCKSTQALFDHKPIVQKITVWVKRIDMFAVHFHKKLLTLLEITLVKLYFHTICFTRVRSKGTL